MRKNYTTRLDDETRESLQKIAGENKMSLGDLVYRVLVWYVKNRKKVKLLF